LSQGKAGSICVAGKLGEREAKKFLRRQGLKFLTANFRSARGEIDLISAMAIA